MLVSFGVDRTRLLAVGRGKSQLKIPTPLADQRNRRVEFIVSCSADTPKVASGRRGRP